MYSGCAWLAGLVCLRICLRACLRVYVSCAQFLTRAKEHFGSGWTWLIVKPDGGLQYTDTLNQDNPLMQVWGTLCRCIWGRCIQHARNLPVCAAQ